MWPFLTDIAEIPTEVFLGEICLPWPAWVALCAAFAAVWRSREKMVTDYRETLRRFEDRFLGQRVGDETE